MSLSGAAVFRGDRLAYFMDRYEAGGFMFFTEEDNRATMVLDCPGCEETKITVEIFQIANDKKYTSFGSEIVFDFRVKAAGRIQDFSCQKFPAEKEFMEAMQQNLAALIREQMEASLDKAREMQADIFGLGNVIYRKYPSKWAELADDWPETFAEDVEVNFDIEANIQRHGQINEPLPIR